jgi:hypothetical protein
MKKTTIIEKQKTKEAFVPENDNSVRQIPDIPYT